MCINTTNKRLAAAALILSNKKLPNLKSNKRVTWSEHLVTIHHVERIVEEINRHLFYSIQKSNDFQLNALDAMDEESFCFPDASCSGEVNVALDRWAASEDTSFASDEQDCEISASGSTSFSFSPPSCPIRLASESESSGEIDSINESLSILRLQNSSHSSNSSASSISLPPCPTRQSSIVYENNDTYIDANREKFWI